MNQERISPRIPPHNLEAEMSLLGALMIDKDAIIKIGDLISEDDFYRDANKIVFAAMRDLYIAHEPIDIISLSTKLDDQGRLESVGGRTYLSALTNAVATSSNILHYAKIVQKKATLRRLQSAAAKISELSFQEDDDVTEILDGAEKEIFSVSQKLASNNFVGVSSLIESAFERLEELHKVGNKKMRGVPTKFHDLDKLLAGLQKSDLLILAARPSVGKTSFALDLARQTAVYSKASVGVFSLEMSKEQLVDRMLCAQAGVSLWRMRTGNLSDKGEDNDFSRIGEAMARLSEASIFIDDSPNCTVMEIRTKARRLQIDKGLDVLIIDYLQLMGGNGKYKDNRVQEVSEITRGLKGIARELNIPVIALSQLSRAVEQQKPAIPKMAHLRESGSIEQDADIVMFIYRKAADRNYNREELPPEERTKAEIHIAKHRNGPTGKMDLFFDEESACFRNLDKSGLSDLEE